jgi:hypothetical protein
MDKIGGKSTYLVSPRLRNHDKDQVSRRKKSVAVGLGWLEEEEEEEDDEDEGGKTRLV